MLSKAQHWLKPSEKVKTKLYCFDIVLYRGQLSEYYGRMVLILNYLVEYLPNILNISWYCYWHQMYIESTLSLNFMCEIWRLYHVKHLTLVENSLFGLHIWGDSLSVAWGRVPYASVTLTCSLVTFDNKWYRSRSINFVVFVVFDLSPEFVW